MATQEKHIYEIPNEQEVELAAAGSRILAACSG
ncbi:MAG: DNA-binding protein, partial [Gammaproteobacteria bacterium]|nr:DNA-binding protein [Gammaproteobacteria bacterium]